MIPSGTGSTCGPVNGPVTGGGRMQFYDYTGPAYFHCFASALQANGDPRDNSNTTQTWCNGTGLGNWNVSRFRKPRHRMCGWRAELNADTLVGRYRWPAYLLFFNFLNEGEDFRSIWRHSPGLYALRHSSEQMEPCDPSIIPWPPVEIRVTATAPLKGHNSRRFTPPVLQYIIQYTRHIYTAHFTNPK